MNDALKQYIDLYKSHREAIEAHAPAAMNALRAEALEVLEQGHLPRRGEENYEVSDIEEMYAPDYGVNINRVDLGADAAEAFRCDVPNMSTWMYFFFNDIFKASRKSPSLPADVVVEPFSEAAERHPEILNRYLGSVAPHSDVRVALNTLLGQEGLLVYVPENVVLEPYYNFVLDIPENMIGRAMTDIENRFGTMEPPEISGQRASIRGYAPVATLRDYQENVYAYTSGTGSISVSLRGYDVCHNPEKVIAEIGYDAEQDMRNPSSSVFCAQGSGFIVPWDQVKAYMHVQDEVEGEAVAVEATIRSREKFDYTIGLEEIEEIYNKTFSFILNLKKIIIKNYIF